MFNMRGPELSVQSTFPLRGMMVTRVRACEPYEYMAQALRGTPARCAFGNGEVMRLDGLVGFPKAL
jgi:hypothetical protein